MAKGSKLSFRDRLRLRKLGQRNKYKGEDSWARRERENRRKNAKYKRNQKFVDIGTFLLIIAIPICLSLMICFQFKFDDKKCTKVYGSGWDHRIKDNPDDSREASVNLEYCYNITTNEEKPVTVKP